MCRLHTKRGFLERSLADLSAALNRAQVVETVALRKGFLQSLPARSKVVSALLLIAGAVVTHSLYATGALLALVAALAIASRIPLALLFRVTGFSVLSFTGIIALPAIVLTPGHAIGHVPWVGWIVTDNGLRSAALLVGRAEVCVCITLLLALSTSWSAILRALATLGIPRRVIAIVGMTSRYILLLSESALNMLQARRSRIVAPLPAALKRKIAVQTAGALLNKSVRLSEEVSYAMQSRGFRGTL
jgi:cobalt/nickel transport system permease protein